MPKWFYKDKDLSIGVFYLSFKNIFSFPDWIYENFGLHAFAFIHFLFQNTLIKGALCCFGEERSSLTDFFFYAKQTKYITLFWFHDWINKLN